MQPGAALNKHEPSTKLRESDGNSGVHHLRSLEPTDITNLNKSICPSRAGRMPDSRLNAKMQLSQLQLCGTRSGQNDAARDRRPRTVTDVANTTSRKDP